MGVFGIASNRPKQGRSKKLLERMANFLMHEPWYAWRHSYDDGLIAMGMIDLEYKRHELQPVFNEDSTMCLLMFGELFGYEPAKRALLKRGHRFQYDTDAEFLLHYYEEHGEGGLADLNGAFVCALWDLKNKRLLLINDRYGFYPLYYQQNSAGLADLMFSPSATCLLRFMDSGQLNEDAVADFLTFGYILDNKTLASAIQLLPPGAILTYDLRESKISLARYWRIQYSYDLTSNENTDDLLDEVAHAFRQAVMLRYQKDGDSEIAVSLSGGLDTRVIVSALTQAGYEGFYTYTWGIPGCTDERIASKVAERINAAHEFFPVKPEPWAQCMDKIAKFGDGQFNIIDHVGFPVCPELSTRFSISLSGVISGLARGFFYNILDRAEGGELCERLYQDISVFPQDFMGIFDSTKHAREMVDRSRSSLRRALEVTHQTREEDILDVFYLQQRARRFIFLGNWFLRNHVEVRNPFLDNTYVDTILRVPPNLRKKPDLWVAILERLSPRLHDIPFERHRSVQSKRRRRLVKPLLTYCGLLELGRKFETRFKRRKKLTKPIYDFDNWFRGPLRQDIEDILLDPRTCNYWGYNKSQLGRVLTQHMTGAENLSRQIGLILTLELWRRQAF